MHELTLCQHAIEIMQEQAKSNNAKRITAVWFEIGAFSCVEPESLRFCFDMVSKDTMAEGCDLHLIEQEMQSYCNDCKEDVQLLVPQVLVCPKCSGRNLRVNADDGMQIKRLEIE